ETSHGLFASDAAMDKAKQKTLRSGFLDGSDIIKAFSWVQPNELVWKYWINNYLLGLAPPALEVMYWSSDCTRIPARLHSDLLDIQAGNLFTKPGQLKILGQAIDLSQVCCDKYVVAGSKDHISPWTLSYETARLFGGEFEFVLNLSGHVPTILNPPGNPKAKFIVGSRTADDVHLSVEQGELVNESWWPHWQKWLACRSGKLKSAKKTLGNKRFPPGTPAPGKYVLEP
ncbi:MAG TPA: hypothetical protein PLW86_07420, partial [Rhodocyclaceae bacterium]|nr:hypothetical protein [Rhodocyclaceae bacterium]